jgi:hypothetical protein
VLGIAGGVLGGGFIRINNWFNMIRKKYLNTKLKKILEGLLLTTITVSFMFLIVGLSYQYGNNQGIYDVKLIQIFNETS